MFGGNGGNEDAWRLREELTRLQRERGEAVGMVQILKSKLSEAEEDNFDLRANMVAIEAEIKYESTKSEAVMQKQVSSLESKLSFLNEQLKTADRVKLRALRELEELQQRQLLEQKRLDAEKRLLATKKRKHESVIYAASQSIMTRMSQIEKQPTAVAATTTTATSVSKQQTPSTSTAATAAQTDPPNRRDRLAAENAELLSTLMSTAARDLLILFKGSSELSAETSNESGNGDGNQTQGGAPVAASEQQLHTAASSSSSSHSHPSQFVQTVDPSSSSVGFSQSVFSQLAGHANAQVQASILNFAKEANLTHAAYVNERAKDLHDVLASLLQGDVTTVALAPVLVRYLVAPTDLDTTVLCSVLRVLYLVIVHSECFQEFLLVASSSSSSSTSTSTGGPTTSSTTRHREDTSGMNSGRSTMEHPRISFAGLRYTSLDDYLCSRKDDSHLDHASQSSQAQEQALSDQMQLRAKLLSALCRVIKNNVNDPQVVECGLSLLALWVDVGVVNCTLHADFRALVSSNVIQEIVLAPKCVTIKLKTKALSILLELVHFQETFPEIEVSSRRSLLFNRCAKMLSGGLGNTTGGSSTHSTKLATTTGSSDLLRPLQRVVVRLFLTIVITYPSMGIRFVLESTRGLPNDDDRELSVIYHLAQLLHGETFDARTLGLDALDRLLRDASRLALIQDAFALLSLLVRYVDLARELGGPHHEHAFLSVLYLLSSTKFDLPKNNTISKTAAAIVALMHQQSSVSASSSS